MDKMNIIVDPPNNFKTVKNPNDEHLNIFSSNMVKTPNPSAPIKDFPESPVIEGVSPVGGNFVKELWTKLSSSNLRIVLLIFNTFSIIGIIAILVYFLLALKSMDSYYDLVIHSSEINLSIINLRLDYSGASTIALAYLLTGEQSYISTTNNTLDSGLSEYNNLKNLVSDNDDQIYELDVLYPILQERTKLLSDIPSLYTGVLPDAKVSSAVNKTIIVNTQFRDILVVMENKENAILEDRKNEHKNLLIH